MKRVSKRVWDQANYGTCGIVHCIQELRRVWDRALYTGHLGLCVQCAKGWGSQCSKLTSQNGIAQKTGW